MKYFEYKKLKFRFVSFWYKKWDIGFFIKQNKIIINEGATCINYSQQCFEGIKIILKKKKIKYFNLNLNSYRFQKSNKVLLIPILSIFFFISINKILSNINYYYIPNKKIGFLYSRPLILGIDKNIGVKTSKKFFLTFFCVPFFFRKSYLNIKSIFKNRVLKNYGNYKIGGNYITNILNSYIIKKYNFNDYIHINNDFFEEIGTSNYILYKKKNIISPNNKNILPGVNKFFFLFFFKFKKILLKNLTNFNIISNSKNLISCGTIANYKKVNIIIFKNKLLKFKNNCKLLKYFLNKNEI